MKTLVYILRSICMLTLICSFASAQVDTVTILHVNDSHSNLAPGGPRNASLIGTRGGIARVATIVGMTKMTEPNVVTVHSGDFSIGDLFYNVYFGVPELRILAALGVDAMAVGNHEFDLTPSTFKTALDSGFVDGGFPLLAANLNLDAAEVQPLKNYIQPYTIKQFGDVKVGMFGLITPATNILSLPAPAYVDSNFIGAATVAVESLQANGCKLILCLSHLGVYYDQLVATYVPGIDVIVGGHDHYEYSTPIQVINAANDTTFIVQANAFYRNVGKMRLIISPGSVKLLDYENIAVDENVPEEPTTAATVSYLISGIEAQYGLPLYSQKVSYVSKDFEEVADSLLNRGRKDTPIGNLVADAFRATFGTQIAFEVGGSTAQPLYRGPIVGADLFRTVGYGFNTGNGLGYRMATFQLTGAALMAGLEFGLASIEENDEFLAQVSGMRYIYNPQKAKGSRVISAAVGGSTLDPGASYSVAANEFVLVFLDYLQIPYANARIYADTTEFQVLLAYASQFDTLSPVVDGRVRCDTVTTDVHEVRLFPERITLYQNYPNPFNPSTVILYELPERSHVTLRVHDLLGREITTLVDEVQEAGSRFVRFDASRLAAGVYFYRLNVGNVVQTKRMLLMK